MSQILYLVSQGCDSTKLQPTNKRLVDFLHQPVIAPDDQNLQVDTLQAMRLLVRIFKNPLKAMKRRFSSFQLVLGLFFIYNCQQKFPSLPDNELRNAVLAFLLDFPDDDKKKATFQIANQILSRHILSISSAPDTSRPDKRRMNSNEGAPHNKRAKRNTPSPKTVKKPIFRSIPTDSSYTESRLAIRSGHSSSLSPIAGPSTLSKP